MEATQTSRRQQTAPPQPCCSKDVTAHPHGPRARPGRPCPAPACRGQPQSGRIVFNPAFGTELHKKQTLTMRTTGSPKEVTKHFSGVHGKTITLNHMQVLMNGWTAKRVVTYPRCKAGPKKSTSSQTVNTVPQDKVAEASAVSPSPRDQIVPQHLQAATDESVSDDDSSNLLQINVRYTTSRASERCFVKAL